LIWCNAAYRRAAVTLTTKTGWSYSKRYLAQQWERTCKAAGIVGLHFHDIRGTITMLVAEGDSRPDRPRWDRIDGPDKYDRNSARLFLQNFNDDRGRGQDHVGRERKQFRCVSATLSKIVARTPTHIVADVTAFDPYAVGLLPARPKRPHRRTTRKRDELARPDVVHASYEADVVNLGDAVSAAPFCARPKNTTSGHSCCTAEYYSADVVTRWSERAKASTGRASLMADIAESIVRRSPRRWNGAGPGIVGLLPFAGRIRSRIC
jgi:hypothetical protein